MARRVNLLEEESELKVPRSTGVRPRPTPSDDQRVVPLHLSETSILALSNYLRVLLYFSNSISSNREGFSVILIRSEKTSEEPLIINKDMAEYVANEFFGIAVAPTAPSNYLTFMGYFNGLTKTEKILGLLKLSDSARYYVSGIVPQLTEKHEKIFGGIASSNRGEKRYVIGGSIVPKNLDFVTVASALIYCIVCTLEYSNLVSEILDSDIRNCVMMILPEKYSDETFKLAECDDVHVGNSFERLSSCGVNLNDFQKDLFRKAIQYIAEVCDVSEEARQRVCFFAFHEQL
jgi:hypothetical protein